MNFRHQNLRGQSLKGKFLIGTDFSGADIRGTNLAGSNLMGANLSQVRTGLRSEWRIGLIIGLFLLTAITSFIATYTGAFAGTAFPIIETVTGQGIASTLAGLLLIAFIGIVLWCGLGKEMWAFAVVLTLAITIVLASPGIENTRLVFLIFAFALALKIAGVVTGAITVAVARTLFTRWMVALIIPIVLTAALQGIRSGAGTTEAYVLIVAGLTFVLLLGLSIYIGWQASISNPKYALICKIAVAVCNYGATSFRGANLTDANFAGANLKHADFRDATLTRTRWFQTKHLAQARTTGTYLEIPKIRELVVGLNGQDQNFDHMDLRGFNLQGANLADASFIGAKLSEATLQDADLARAKLVQTQLYGANLSGACLTGAIIQDWSISTDTNFAAVKCEYIYMQLPTRSDPDPCRKPDNRNESFQDGDFADFIAPIMKTLNLYQTQNVDLRVVARHFKTLDLFHHEGIDPGAAAIALKQLAEQHPEADIEVVALEGRGDEKVRVQAKVAGVADRSALSAEYFQTYRELASLPYADLQTLLAGMAEKDERIRSLEKMVTTAIESNKFYVETYYNWGDTVSEKGAINVNSGGGNISGIVGGDIKDASGIVNLGTISGNVSNAIGQLPDSSPSDEPGIKDLLRQLQEIIETDTELPQKGKEIALTQVKVLAEVAQNPEQPEKKSMGTQALNLLKGAASFLPETAQLAEASVKLLPLIGTLLGLPV